MSIDHNGFIRRTLDEVVVELSTKVKNTIGNINLDPSNLIYQWLKVVAGRQIQLETLAELIIANITPQGASGVFVDYHLLMNGLKRKDAEHAVGTLEITNGINVANQEIPIGVIFSTSDGVQYVTIDNAIFVDKIRLTNTPSGKDAINSKYYTLTPDADYGPLGQATANSVATTSVVTATALQDVSSTGNIYFADISGDPYVVYSYEYSSYSSTDKTFTMVDDPVNGSTGLFYYDVDSAIDAYWINGLTNTSSVNKEAIYYLCNTDNYIQYVDKHFTSGQNYYMLMTAPMTLSTSVKSVEIGTDGNTGSNTITYNTNSYGTQYVSSVTNNIGITNGTNMEGDNSSKARILDAKNRHFTTGSIKDMVNNIQGVRDCKVSQVVSSDVVYPIDWQTSMPGSPTTFVFDEYKVIRTFFSPIDVTTIKGLTIYAKYKGEPSDLYLQMIRINSYLGPSDTTIMSTSSISRGDMKDGEDVYQEITFPISYEGLERSYVYYLNIYVGDNNACDEFNYWTLIKDPDATGATINHVADNNGQCNLSAIAVSGSNYLNYEYIGSIADTPLTSDVNTILIGDEEALPATFFSTYGIIVLDTDAVSAGLTTYSPNVLTLDTTDTSGVGDDVVVNTIIFDDGNLPVITATATLDSTPANSTLTYSSDIELGATPTDFTVVIYPTDVSAIINNYEAGTLMQFYEDITDVPSGDLAIKTWYGIPAINVSIVPEEGYDFESDLKDDIENMLDWEGGEGYCPLGIEYTVSEASELLMIVSFFVGYTEGYNIVDISNLVEENLITYLSTLNPGDDIIYSQIEKVILLTDGIYKVRDLSITVNNVESASNNEVDILINEGEYVSLESVSLKQL